MPSRKYYGKRCQELCIDEVVQLTNDNPTTPLEPSLRRVSTRHFVITRTLRRWYENYLAWEEYPHETKLKIQRFKRNSKCTRSSVITDEIIHTLDAIVKKNP